MKITSLLFLFVAFSFARAEDWDVLGRTFHNVTVTQVEADRVHITYDGGLGTIPIANMPPELRKRFTSDVAGAKAAADAREKARLAVVASLPPPAPAPVVVAVIPPVAAKTPAPTVAMGSINDDVLGHVVSEDPKDAHGKNNHVYSAGANDH